jgi:glycosyltransferase involved in cell wall biosynthesis
MVFFARVMREKGIFEAIELAKVLHKAQVDISLDIIGPICFSESRDCLAFNGELTKNADLLNYCGCIDPINVQSVLSRYNILLFPTRYEGEGFPGSIVDAMMSGLCVICTDWRYNKEIIEHTQCGYVLAGDFVEEAEIIVRQLSRSPFSLMHVMNESLRGAQAYSASAFDHWYDQVIRDDVR